MEVSHNQSFAGELEEMSLSFILARPIINFSIFPALEFFCLEESKRFARAPVFLIFDDESKHFSAVLSGDGENQFKRPKFAVFEKRL